MLVLILIFIIAALSFFLYAHIWSAREGRKAHLVHAAAVSAHASNAPVEVPQGTTAAASSFFQLYGTTPKKYESITSPVTYAGYVNLDHEEVITIVFRHRSGLTVTTHTLSCQFGNDLVSLIQKAQYLKHILKMYLENYKEDVGNAQISFNDSKAQKIMRLRNWLENETVWEEKNKSDEDLVIINKLVLGSATQMGHPKVKRIPAEIFAMENLEDLHLQYNDLESLPSTVCNIATLKKLRLGGNSLESLPASIKNLKRLELLTLWSNNLKSLPEEIGELVNLKALNISDNADLNHLPDSIIRLTNLEEFEWYGSGEHKLTVQQIGWLKSLRVKGCRIDLNDDGALDA
ncbi:leucine-rich repeat domain-containing protein [Pseudomonas extremaustralis]|uniref:leucine-rich repeat domain-containing protein n=1 Tax=Pseudomonas extremaustralis TaxID=359110 RepID=UPI002856BDC8|nr:leucine-rich repeat domain-containing protein [Pseudomonas extremaustralis]MDR6579953.1 hypothetical protein [Pseudomonas extremaustralis]